VTRLTTGRWSVPGFVDNQRVLVAYPTRLCLVPITGVVGECAARPAPPGDGTGLLYGPG
jgi:hypothetical protein